MTGGAGFQGFLPSAVDECFLNMCFLNIICRAGVSLEKLRGKILMV